MINLESRITYGCDPEAFFERNGEVIGSEKVLPQSGWNYVKRDGVQIEFQPLAYGSAKSQVAHLRDVMDSFKNHLTYFPDVKVCFKPVVQVSEAEIATLGEESRLLGCKPSDNIYGFKQIDVDGQVFRTRSAGGHLHIGLYDETRIWNMNVYPHLDERARLVPILDVLVGNTCVLFDTDPVQRQRRKMYGRPGEYRLPWHGVEYRTLSNFWMRSPILAELVFGLAQLSVGILSTTLEGKENLEKELLYNLDWRKIVKAIYLNDRTTALENWKVVRDFLIKQAPSGSVVNGGNIRKFDKFIEIVGEQGLDVFFPMEGEAVLKGWTSGSYKVSWDNFLGSIQ